MEDVDDDTYSDLGVRMYNDVEVMNDVDAYIDEGIKPVPHYRNLLHYMNKMKDYDKLRIRINSYGGNVDAAIEICKCMQKAEGQVQVIVSGNCCSAASVIALGAPELIIEDSAYMMIHAATFGIVGKHNENISRMAFYDTQLKELFYRTYEGFMTQDEMDKCLEGKDYWFDNKEVIRRLEMRAEYQKELIKKAPDISEE
jgi:ATP-dependent protease ClpP protease subunit